MDELMARTMVENESIGIDPFTGKLLRQGDSCANELVREAIQTVLDHCTIDSYATILERQRKEKRRTEDPVSESGKTFDKKRRGNVLRPLP